VILQNSFTEQTEQTAWRFFDWVMVVVNNIAMAIVLRFCILQGQGQRGDRWDR